MAEESTTKGSLSIEEMRAQIAAHDEKVSAEAQAHADEALQPACDLCENLAFEDQMAQIEDARIAVAAHPQVASLLDGLRRTMDALPSAIQRAKRKAAEDYRNQQESAS